MRAIGIAIPFFRRRAGVPIDAQAQVHFNRVVADGGVVPSGLSGVNAFFSAVKAIYGTSDINTAISAAYDAHYLGYKLGAGSGTTLGQAAQKLYSVKSTENLILQSENFASASWVKSNSTITSNVIAAPDGTMTADLFQTSAAFGFTSQSIARASAGIYTFSCYIKGVSGVASIGSLIYNRGIGFTITSSGVITVNNPVGYSAASNFQITNVGDGWYRISCNFSYAAGSDGILIASSNSGDSFYIWGIQLNTDSVALPYTPTTTTAQTLADVTQTTAASQPLLLAHTGENYWWGSGVSGNYCSTPNAAANQIRGNMDFIVYANFTTTNTTFLSKWGNLGSDRQYLFLQNASRLEFVINVAGIVSHQSTVNNPLVGTIGWARCTRNSSNGNVEFFTSTDAANTPISSINWTKLGATVSGATGDTINSTTQIEVGSWLNGVNNIYTGRIFRATISNTIGGTPVVDFNPASYNPSVSQTQWTSATSEIWTINTSLGTGTGYRGLLVDRSYVMSDGIDDAMVNTFTLATIKTIYNTYKIWDVTATGSLFASNNGAEVVDANLTGTGNCLQYDNAVNQITISLTGTGNRYTMRTAVINGANSLQQINNGTAATGTLGTSNSTSMKIFQERNGSFKSKMVFSGMFLSLSADNTTQRTAIYNYLRSINNNAF